MRNLLLNRTVTNSRRCVRCRTVIGEERDVTISEKIDDEYHEKQCE